MELLIKLLLIALLYIFTYFWNRIVPKFIVSGLVNFHRAFNKNNINRQPVKIVLANEDNIINIFKYFYWFAFAGFVYIILANDFSALTN